MPKVTNRPPLASLVVIDTSIPEGTITTPLVSFILSKGSSYFHSS
nr:MAG TPA: hypothetical protein [Caudoviricetes sp.]